MNDQDYKINVNMLFDILRYDLSLFDKMTKGINISSDKKVRLRNLIIKRALLERIEDSDLSDIEDLEYMEIKKELDLLTPRIDLIDEDFFNLQ